MQFCFHTTLAFLLTLSGTFTSATEIAGQDSIPAFQNTQGKKEQENAGHQGLVQSALRDSILLVRSEIEQLQSVIERSTFGIPSYYFTNLRSWIIPSSAAFNDSLAEYFFEVSEHDSTFVLQRGDIQVIATGGDTVDLVGIVFSGNEQERKGQRLRDHLNKKPERNMYQRVLLSGVYGEERLLVDNKFKVANQLRPRVVKDGDFLLSHFTRTDVSSGFEQPSGRIILRIPDRAHLRLGPLWGVEWNLGNEEVGYPFWLSGNMSVLATYQQIKFGVQFPFAGGRFVGESLGKILPSRKLDGTYGAQVKFDVGVAGGSFMVGLHRTDVNGTFVNPDEIYTLRNFGQLWYSYGVAVGNDNKENILRFKLGIGFHQIGFDRLYPARTVLENTIAVQRRKEILPTATIRSFWSPYINVDFMNQQFINRFGATFQYYNEWGIMTTWLEIVKDRVRLELKGAAPLLRKHQQWEPTYLVMLNIPVTLALR
jgi:hypothetical protein